MTNPNSGKRKAASLRSRSRTRVVATDCLVTQADGTQYVIPARKTPKRNEQAAHYRQTVKRATLFEQERARAQRTQNIGTYGEGTRV